MASTAADVDRVLHDYLDVVRRSDDDKHKLLTSQQELEALLLQCRSELAHQQAVCDRMALDHKSVSEELSAASTTIAGQEKELQRHRDFARMVRRSLVVDDVNAFSLADVSQVLRGRLDDYALLLRQWQELKSVYEQERIEQSQRLLAMESEHRRTMHILVDEAQGTIKDMLQQVHAAVGATSADAAASAAAAQASVAQAEAENRRLLDTLSPEMAKLRAHVDELLQQKDSLAKSNELLHQRLADAEAVIVAVQTARNEACAAARVVVTADVEQLLGDAMESFSALRYAMGCQMHSLLTSCVTSSSSAQTLAVVNDELRRQLSSVTNSLKLKHSRHVEQLMAKQQQSSDGFKTQLGSLSEKVVALESRDAMLSDRLREAAAHNHELRQTVDVLQSKSQVQQEHMQKVERSLTRRAEEVDNLKALLSQLQSRSAELRDVHLASEARMAALDRDKKELTHEVRLLHETIHEHRQSQTEMEAQYTAQQERLMASEATLRAEVDRLRSQLDEVSKGRASEAAAASAKWSELTVEHHKCRMQLEETKEALALQAMHAKHESVLAENRAAAEVRRMEMEMQSLKDTLATMQQRNDVLAKQQQQQQQQQTADSRQNMSNGKTESVFVKATSSMEGRPLRRRTSASNDSRNATSRSSSTATSSSPSSFSSSARRSQSRRSRNLKMNRHSRRTPLEEEEQKILQNAWSSYSIPSYSPNTTMMMVDPSITRIASPPSPHYYSAAMRRGGEPQQEAAAATAAENAMLRERLEQARLAVDFGARHSAKLREELERVKLTAF